MKISIAVFQQRYFSFRKEISVYTTFPTFYSILRKCKNKCRKEGKRSRNLMYGSTKEKRKTSCVNGMLKFRRKGNLVKGNGKVSGVILELWGSFLPLS